MSKRYLAALASILLGSSVAYAQVQVSVSPVIVPEPGPMPPAIHAGRDVPEPSPYIEVGCQSQTIFTVDAEYLLWFFANSHDSSTVASSNFLSVPEARILGVLGNAEHASKRPTSGGRLALGYWQVENSPWNPGVIRDMGVEAVFFVLGERGVDFRIGPTPNLVRPFFDLNNRKESGFIVASPGLATGEISGNAQASLWGAEINAWKNVYYNCPGTTYSLALMAGLRFLNADHELEIRSTTVYDPGIPAASPFFTFAGNRLDVVDSFSTHNRFYGGQVGLSSKCWPMPRLSFEAVFKLALGVNSEDLNIAGSQVRTFADSTTQLYNGGLLALPSNIGHFHLNKFAQVPEFDGKVACDVTNHLTLFTGFSALYWSRIIRGGKQIDREIDITQIPNFPPAAGAIPTGLGRPGVSFDQSDLWVFGMNFGLEYKW